MFELVLKILAVAVVCYIISSAAIDKGKELDENCNCKKER